MNITVRNRERWVQGDTLQLILYDAERYVAVTTLDSIRLLEVVPTQFISSIYINKFEPPWLCYRERLSSWPCIDIVELKNRIKGATCDQGALCSGMYKVFDMYSKHSLLTATLFIRNDRTEDFINSGTISRQRIYNAYTEHVKP